jgi:hypothetical protein
MSCTQDHTPKLCIQLEVDTSAWRDSHIRHTSHVGFIHCCCCVDSTLNSVCGHGHACTDSKLQMPRGICMWKGIYNFILRYHAVETLSCRDIIELTCSCWSSIFTSFCALSTSHSSEWQQHMCNRWHTGTWAWRNYHRPHCKENLLVRLSSSAQMKGNKTKLGSIIVECPQSVEAIRRLQTGADGPNWIVSQGGGPPTFPTTKYVWNIITNKTVCKS